MNDTNSPTRTIRWPVNGRPPSRLWTYEEAMEDALAKHPDCTYADWDNGLDPLLNLTIVVKLWRNQDCYLNDDPPKYIEQGYYRA